MSVCPECGGSGYITEYSIANQRTGNFFGCFLCHGTGLVSDTQNVSGSRAECGKRQPMPMCASGPKAVDGEGEDV